jgi:hypothetical protein
VRLKNRPFSIKNLTTGAFGLAGLVTEKSNTVIDFTTTIHAELCMRFEFDNMRKATLFPGCGFKGTSIFARSSMTFCAYEPGFSGLV